MSVMVTMGMKKPERLSSMMMTIKKGPVMRKSRLKLRKLKKEVLEANKTRNVNNSDIYITQLDRL